MENKKFWIVFGILFVGGIILFINEISILLLCISFLWGLHGFSKFSFKKLKNISKTFKYSLIAYLLIVYLLFLVPLIGLVFDWIGQLFGCHDYFMNGCTPGIGHFFGMMSVNFAFFSFITIPLGAILVLLGIIFLCIIAWKNRQNE